MKVLTYAMPCRAPAGQREEIKASAPAPLEKI